jgi:NADH:ubiquinone oxidoreductase subunit 3 (subunit A)
MLDNWLFVGLLIIVALGFPIAPIILGAIIGPKRPNQIKQETYECGIETVGETWIQFKVQYYIYALVFLIFDIEVVFLFPWAVAFDVLPLFAVIEGVIFIVILAGGLVYAWRKGILEWL